MHWVKKVEKEFFFELMLFCFGVLVVALTYPKNWLTLLLLLLGWIFSLILWHKKEDVYFFITGAVLGPLGEIVCIYYGTWEYANPTFWGIPIWLPILWGIAIAFIKRLSETLYRLLN